MSEGQYFLCIYSMLNNQNEIILISTSIKLIYGLFDLLKNSVYALSIFSM